MARRVISAITDRVAGEVITVGPLVAPETYYDYQFILLLGENPPGSNLVDVQLELLAASSVATRGANSGRVIQTNNWPPNAFIGSAGTPLRLGNDRRVLTADAIADALGRATLEIDAPLSQSVPNGEPVRCGAHNYWSGSAILGGLDRIDPRTGIPITEAIVQWGQEDPITRRKRQKPGNVQIRGVVTFNVALRAGVAIDLIETAPLAAVRL